MAMPISRAVCSVSTRISSDRDVPTVAYFSDPPSASNRTRIALFLGRGKVYRGRGRLARNSMAARQHPSFFHHVCPGSMMICALPDARPGVHGVVGSLEIPAPVPVSAGADTDAYAYADEEEDNDDSSQRRT
jgi:hypothetical protein